MRRVASRKISASCASPGSFDSCAASTASTATADATSPALAPPMPSATANSGGRTARESSFAVRWRPTSVRPACSTMRSATPLLLVAVFAVADPNRVAHRQRLSRLHLATVEVGAVGRAQVLEVHGPALVVDARVGGGCELVVYAYFGPVRAAEGRAVAHVEARAGLVPHRGDARQPRGASVPRGLRARRAASGAGRLDGLGGGGAAVAGEVAHGAADHPQ